MTMEVQTPKNETDAESNKTEQNTFSDKILATNSLKIIDLNASLVNFNAAFTVKSETGKPFQIIAVNEKALDEADKLDFKVAESGQISGQIFSDVDKLSNYILVIKTIEEGEEMNCEVDITRTEIPAWSRTKKPLETPQPQTVKPRSNNSPMKPIVNPDRKNEKLEPKTIENYVPEKEEGFFSKYRMYIIGLIVLCILALLAYYLFFRKATPPAPSAVSIEPVVNTSIPEKSVTNNIVPDQAPRTDVMNALENFNISN